MAKKHGIKSFPTLAFFRNKEPLIFKGDLDDEDEVLSWITDENTLEIPGKIEEVNSRMLENILEENDYVVVFFCKYYFSSFFKVFNLILNINNYLPKFQIRKETRRVKKFFKNWKILTMNARRRTLIL